ncbi:ester cyclase [Streptomyces sp. CLV115]|uniref:ester cyclase n=1 Tax=Streptomyces sp. CLV115 TaxID=3138502 RepID=UPI00313ABA03
MRVVVAGATGRIGSRTVARSRNHGVEVTPVSRGEGADVITGRGLTEALRGTAVKMDSRLIAAFDDLATTVFDQITEEDKVATRWRLGGHHTGRFLDCPPTGRYASFTTTTVDRL